MKKELATEKEATVLKTGVARIQYQFGHEQVDGQIAGTDRPVVPKNEGYVYDYGNKFILIDQYDSKRSYKHPNCFSGIASIDNFPVYIKNRNGNRNVKYKQNQTMKRVYEVIGGFGIKVKHSRKDSGSFEQKDIPVVEANSEYYYS